VVVIFSWPSECSSPLSAAGARCTHKEKGWGCLNHHTLPFGLDPPLTGIAIRAFEDFTA